MALQGYWAICEEICPQTGKGAGKPSMCFVHIDGFFNADAMAGSRHEAVSVSVRNLKNNIHFLLDCYADVPAPQSSDYPPRARFPAGTTLAFIALQDLGLTDAQFKEVA